MFIGNNFIRELECNDFFFYQLTFHVETQYIWEYTGARNILQFFVINYFK